MPVTSSTTSVKRWPTPDRVLDALRGWANVQAASQADLVALGYFGSHARGDTAGHPLQSLPSLVATDAHSRARIRIANAAHRNEATHAK